MSHYDDDEDELIHAKVVLLGSAGVGKTCLAIKYKTGNFPTMATPTIGASYMAKTVYVNHIHINNDHSLEQSNPHKSGEQNT